MASATLQSRSKQPPDAGANFWLRVVMIWHLLLGLSCLGGIFFLWMADGETAVWIKLLLTVVFLATAVASGLVIYDINRRKHRGRVISLAVNYLGFLVCLVGSMHLLGVFTGLDALGETFIQGIPFLILAFVGFFINSRADRYENPGTQRALKLMGRWIMIVAAVALILVLSLRSGSFAFLEKLTDPTTLLLIIGTIIFAVMLWAMWRQTSAKAMHATNADAEMLDGYLFLSPNLLGFLFFFAGPLLLSLYVSFTNWDAFGTRDWVGAANYAQIVNLDFASLESITQRADEVLDVSIYDELARFSLFGSSFIVGAQDKLFWLSLRNTLMFVLFSVPLSVAPALILSQSIKQ